MSLFICSLNSGSNGNCYYVGNSREAVLVDVGISCREVEKRMKRSGLNINKVKAIFISHEHTDHISGLEVLSRKFQIPVYITPATIKNSKLKLDRKLLRSFEQDEKIKIGSLEIISFMKFHDAADPYSFVVKENEINVGVFTDIGSVCEQVIQNFKKCNAIFLEANYDEEMLMTGRYPAFLKKRISGDKGHLSNAQALRLFQEHKPPFMSHVVLSHLSKENNDPELAHQLFLKHAGKTNVSVASRYEESAVYMIHSADAAQEKAQKRPSKAEQMTLF